VLFIKEYLGFSTEIILSSELEKDNGLKGQEKVIYINKILGADTYYNAIGGMELYDSSSFAKEGIKLSFLQMEPVEYKQFKNGFVPNLSILDVLMFNSPNETNNLLTKYTLIEVK
ncbi:MAG: WbqC family protein, partial [Odoribacter sp.]|nr:WbqC family protein [Odoribacter sp.]